jgi:hypothetical protein
MAREDQAYLARQAIYDRLAREVDPDWQSSPAGACQAQRPKARKHARAFRLTTSVTGALAPAPGYTLRV